ncbi:MAG TPA: glycine cleavage system protein GcvH [Acidimicrobiales bacterium]|nr:glycine cleavage system protein GcvH [Acidimicrobiales bacterium]
MKVPEDRWYTKDHEWALREPGGQVRVGITDYAQDALGDVVYVELPTPGTVVTEGESCGEVESTKSVSEIYAPVPGTIAEVNTELPEAPQRVNEDPYDTGWMFIVQTADETAFENLLDAAAYTALIS